MFSLCFLLNPNKPARGLAVWAAANNFNKRHVPLLRFDLRARAVDEELQCLEAQPRLLLPKSVNRSSGGKFYWRRVWSKLCTSKFVPGDLRRLLFKVLHWLGSDWFTIRR